MASSPSSAHRLRIKIIPIEPYMLPYACKIEMRRYSNKLRQEGGIPLQMRVGVNTSEVVVRSIRKDDLHTDYVPVGHSTNLAARMEQLATPGSIVVSEHTQRLTDGYFEFKALGKTQIKG